MTLRPTHVRHAISPHQPPTYPVAQQAGAQAGPAAAVAAPPAPPPGVSPGEAGAAAGGALLLVRVDERLCGGCKTRSSIGNRLRVPVCRPRWYHIPPRLSLTPYTGTVGYSFCRFCGVGDADRQLPIFHPHSCHPEPAPARLQSSLVYVAAAILCRPRAGQGNVQGKVPACQQCCCCGCT